MKARSIVQAAVIAAIYCALTLLAHLFCIDAGIIQVRFSEMLTILAVFTPAAIPGLFIGCLLSGILTGAMPLDVVFGSLATLAGAIGTWKLRKHPYLSPISPVLCNVIVVPLVLSFVYCFEGAIWFFMITVGIGEVISCWLLGIILYRALLPHQDTLFKRRTR